jgi:hypothetical protein
MLKNHNGMCTLESYGHMLSIVNKIIMGIKEDY